MIDFYYGRLCVCVCVFEFELNKNRNDDDDCDMMCAFHSFGTLKFYNFHFETFSKSKKNVKFFLVVAVVIQKEKR